MSAASSDSWGKFIEYSKKKSLRIHLVLVFALFQEG